MAKETNKGNVQMICAKVTKYASKKVAKAVKLIQIDYEKFNGLWIVLIVYLYPRTI